MAEKMRKVLHAFTALADLGEEIACTSDFEEMVSSSLHVVLGALGIRRGAVAEYDREGARFHFVTARGLKQGPSGNVLPPDLPFAPASITAELSRTNGHAKRLRAQIVEETSASPEPVGQARPSPCDGDAAESATLEKLIKAWFEEWPVEFVMPLVVRDDIVGVILLGEKASGGAFTTEEREILRALGRHIAIGLHNHRLLREVEQRAAENRRLYDDLRAIYKDTVRAFAAAIDCKDKYTQGHSERVGKYSEIIARELGWREEEVEGIAVAGYLHDIGKLVVDRDIINAPYKIDAKQSSELNRHPAAGYEILSPINHPYADIPLMARYHHERIDGRGYPLGLKGDEIPLGAKIVTLADSFDAMTTDRPYKRRRAFDEVVEDLRRNTGKQFAPEVVIAFCRALLKEVNGETHPRQIIRLLGKDYIEAERASPLLKHLITELESGAYASAARN